MSAPSLEHVQHVHRALLERWRVAMDLVGPGPLAPHFADAAAATSGLHAEGAWADLGSGAGFPGIALAARYPGAEVLLVESRERRAAFLATVAAETGLSNVKVFRGRAEDLPRRFDGVIARAFLPPAEYLAIARPLLVPGGRAVVLLGDRPWTPPEGWEIAEESRYRVGDGWRRRAVVRPG